jgi:hypothetical protein
LEVLLSNSNASFYCHSQTTTTIEEDKSWMMLLKKIWFSCSSLSDKQQ